MKCPLGSSCNVTNDALTGNARKITIRNKGSLPATNVVITTTAGFPSDATVATPTGCRTIEAGSSCDVTITPGSIASSDINGDACTSGGIPQGGISISADGGLSESVEVYVLGYGCQYQAGFVFAVDDSYVNHPISESIGGTVAALTDQAAPNSTDGVIWSSNGSGGACTNFPSDCDVSFDVIPGISNESINDAGNPSYSIFTGMFGTINDVNTYESPINLLPSTAFASCNGLTDGVCNTSNIYLFYNVYKTGYSADIAYAGGSNLNYPIPQTPFSAPQVASTLASYYAAGRCKEYSVGDYADWYLPAICEMGYGAAGCGTEAIPILQNMQSNLATKSIVGLDGRHWSSTEFAAFSQYDAWYQDFAVSGSTQSYYNKSNQEGVRCVRRLTI